MYVQCNIDGNKNLLLDSFVDQRKNDSALNVEDQKVTVKCKEIMRKSTVGWDICCE